MAIRATAAPGVGPTPPTCLETMHALAQLRCHHTVETIIHFMRGCDWEQYFVGPLENQFLEVRVMISRCRKCGKYRGEVLEIHSI
jgi:hypothetical protein